MTNFKHGASEPQAQCTHDDAVGYKKPPKHTQFKKGCSGNLSGRPKKSQNSEDFADMLHFAAYGQMTQITVNGKRRRVSMRQASLCQVAINAASGSLPAARELTRMLLPYESRPKTADHGRLVFVIEGSGDDE